MSKYILIGKKPLKIVICCIISKPSVANLREDTNSVLPSKKLPLWFRKTLFSQKYFVEK